MSVLKYDCVKRTAIIHFHAVNISGWASATHFPPIHGYGGSLLDDNDFGNIGHNVRQTIDWNEDVFF